MEKICLKCAKRFPKKVTCSKKEWTTSKYCSHSCANSINSLGNKYSVGRIPWSKGRKFGKSHRNTRVIINCIYCHKPFEIKKYRIGQAKYCSKQCHNKDNLGLTSINYRLRRSLEYEDWRKQVFERDLYTCQMCGEVGGYLQAHHIKSFSEYPELRLSLDNGCTLCIGCHKKTDTYLVNKRYLAVAQEA